MSFKTCLVKIVIKMTPNIVVTSIANLVLKGIAELTDFVFDLDSRTAYLSVTLAGEEEPIEVSVNGFGIVSDESSHQFIVQQAKSNKPWLNNIFSRIVGKSWKIPEQPKYKAQMELMAELLKTENRE